MLSKRGEVKVTDFGLAKATTQLEKTDPGVVKGKFSYLSPEAALGEPVDGRADVFALGIVLWEMLAGRRLFLGETDYQTVKLVQQAKVPSLQRLNPEVTAELEEVLMRALSRDPKHRYESARELGDALAGYLFTNQLKVTSYDIATLVKSVVERKTKAPKARQEASIIDRLIQEELLRFTSLDDMDGSDPMEIGNTPLSPDDVAGAQPLDSSLFENPADWFANDDEVGEAVASASGAPAVDTGWRESGLEPEASDLASLLEADGPNDLAALHIEEPAMEPPPRRSSVPPAPPPPRASDRPSRPSAPTPQRRVELPSPEPMPALPTKSNSMLWLVVIAVLLLAGAGAAAYLTGVIPH